MRILSKRRVIFCTDADTFYKALSDFNRDAGEALGKMPLHEFVTGGKSSFKKISENPQEFIRIMKKLIPDLVTKLEERPSGSKSGITQFYSRIKNSTMNLVHAAHEAGIIPTVYYMHWGLQVQDAVHPGNPFEKKVKELGNKVDEFEKGQAS